MDVSTRKNLASFWKTISVQFDNLLSQYGGEMSIHLHDIEKIKISQKTIFDGNSDRTVVNMAHESSEQADGDTILELVNEGLSGLKNVTSKLKHHNNYVTNVKETPTKGDKQVLNSPRRSSRRAKLPSAYKDYITISKVQPRNEIVNTGYQITVVQGDQLQISNIDSANGLALQESAGLANTKDVITFKTVNPFPEAASTPPVQPMQSETVMGKLILPIVQNIKADCEQTSDSSSDHIYSNQSLETVQILVTMLNQEDGTAVTQAVKEGQFLVTSDVLGDTGDVHTVDKQYEANLSVPTEETVLQKCLNVAPKGDQLLKQNIAQKGRSRPRGSIKKNADGVYECPDCRKRITNYSNLIVHMRIHSGEKPYSCRICARLFSTITNMTRHERTTHDKEKLWQCEQCQKRFTEKKSLVIHQRIHSGERPYKCTMCDQAFAQAGTLKTHMHRHLGIKGHLCDFCGKSFRQKSQLCMHQRRHSNTRNFKCPICSKAFVTKTDLSRHNMSHSGERPYLCSHCPKTFTRLQYLKEHTNMHTNTTPYQCKHCGQAFRDLASHAKHVKRHTQPITADSEMDKETYLVVPSDELFLHTDVPTMVSEECVEEVESEEILSITNLALAMQGSNMQTMVEVAHTEHEQKGTTYLSTEHGADDSHHVIEVQTVGDVSQLGDQYIIIKPASHDGDQIVESVLEQYNMDDNVQEVEISSQDE